MSYRPFTPNITKTEAVHGHVSGEDFEAKHINIQVVGIQQGPQRDGITSFLFRLELCFGIVGDTRLVRYTLADTLGETAAQCMMDAINAQEPWFQAPRGTRSQHHDWHALMDVANEQNKARLLGAVG